MANLLTDKPTLDVVNHGEEGGQLKLLVKGTDYYQLAVSMGLVPENGHAGILYGRFYVTKSGYSYFGQKNKVLAVKTEPIKECCDRATSDWSVKATVFIEGRGTFEGMSRAYPGNVSRGIFGQLGKKKNDKCLETAETHAIRRAFQNAFPELIPTFSDEGEEEVRDIEANVVSSPVTLEQAPEGKYTVQATSGTATGTATTYIVNSVATPFTVQATVAELIPATESEEEETAEAGTKKPRMTKRRKAAMEGLKALVTQHGSDFEDALVESIEANYGSTDLSILTTDQIEEALEKATKALAGEPVQPELPLAAIPAPAAAPAPAASDRNEPLIAERSGWMKPLVGPKPDQLMYPKAADILVSVTRNPQRIRLDKLTVEEWTEVQRLITEALSK